MDNNKTLFDSDSLKNKLEMANIPSSLLEKIEEQIDRIEIALKFGASVHEVDVLIKYVDWISSLPWQTKTEDKIDIKNAKMIMDKNHYGMEKVKQRILEYLSMLALQKKQFSNPHLHAPVLFLVGLAGTGKTTFAKSVAETLGRRFGRIPFGGLSSSLDLRGMSKVQPEAEPGQIIKLLRRVGSKNPVILLDEIDRVSPDARGAIMGVLLELLDPEQNMNFVDHYIDYPFDLSETLFICTANNTTNISTAVLDRLEVIQMPSYTDEEKIVIAKDFILPKLLRESGLTKESLVIDQAVWQKIARLSGYDPGIRSVQRHTEEIVRKVVFKFVNGEGTVFYVNENNMKEYLD